MKDVFHFGRPKTPITKANIAVKAVVADEG